MHACVGFYWLPSWLSGKNLPTNAGNVGSIPWPGRPPRKGNGNPLQYYYLGNSMERGAWLATVHWIAKESDTTEWLNNNIGCHGTTEENLKKKKKVTQHRKRFPKRSDSDSLENNESECNRQMKNGRVVQSKEIAYAVPRGAIVDKKKKASICF